MHVQDLELRSLRRRKEVSQLENRRVMNLSGYNVRGRTQKRTKIAGTKEALYIPLDVMAEILSRVPARSLMRFKCVCKLWNSIIQEQQFIACHLHKRSSTANLNIIILSWIPWIHEFSLHYFAEDCHKFNMRGLQRRGDRDGYQISNSCNGLLCVFGKTTTYVVNPSIRKFLKLPETRHKYGGHVNVALGHDISTGEYKIVRLFQQDQKTIGCMVFTMGSNSWRFLRNMPFDITTSALAVFVNEHIVWEISYFLCTAGPEAAVSFNIKNESFDIINHPDFSSRDPDSCIMEVGGYMCLLDTPDDKCNWHKKELWILKDFYNRKWIKHNINLDKVENLSKGLATQLKLLGIRGGKILMTDQVRRFDFYDPETGCFDKPLYLTYGCATPYVESLISPKAIQENTMCWRRGSEEIVNRCIPWWPEENLNERSRCRRSNDGTWWQWGRHTPLGSGYCKYDDPDMYCSVWSKKNPLPKRLIVYP